MSLHDITKCFFRDRWSATHAPAAGATVIAASPTPVGQARQNCEFIWYSIFNQGVGTGIGFTVTVQIRSASIAGTVLASVDHYVASTTAVQVSTGGMGIPGKRGQAIIATMSTVIASLSQKVSIAGWTEDDNG
jgi:hypothetical protein